jgi:hypothetical protein
MMADISVQRVDWSEWPKLAPTWERIHNLCPDASFFLSREWVDCWLATFGESLNPDLLTFEMEGTVVGGCLLVWRTVWVRGIPLRRVYLNCNGEEDADSTYIEFNSLLCLPEHLLAAAAALAAYLKRRKWDELLLSGMVGQDAVPVLAGSLGRTETQEVPSYYIDFAPYRNPPADFLRSLSSKTRYHIRRTQRSYEEISGACTLTVARNAEEGIEMLHQLAGLHQAKWRERGSSGAFDSPRFTGLHEKMIRENFSRTLLFRVQAGNQAVGLLYCFVFRGWVYLYQSGYSYSLDSRRNPGLLTLCLAISHCIGREELKGFDLMAGDVEYKRSLASVWNPLRWIVVRRPTPRTWLYCGLRFVKRTYVQVLQKSRRKDKPPGGAEHSADASVPDGQA